MILRVCFYSILMMRYFILLMMLVCGLMMSAKAQTPATDNAQSNTLLSIPDKLRMIERSIRQLQQTLENQQSVKQAVDHLQQLNLSESAVAAQIAALSDADAPAVQTAQIKVTEQDNDRIVKWRDMAIMRQQTLNESQDLLTDTDAAVQSIEQLLSNPVNLAGVSTADTEKVVQFKKNIKQLSQQLETQQTAINTFLQQLTATSGRLNRLKSALAGALAAQQQQQIEQSTGYKTALLQDKHQLESHLTDWQTRLQNQRSQMSLADIEALQQRITAAQTRLWLLEIDEKLVDVVRNHAVATGFVSAADTAELNVLEEQHERLERSSATLNSLKKSLDKRFADFQKTVDIIGVQPDLDAAFTQRLKAVAYQQLLLNKASKQLAARIADKKQVMLLSRDRFYQQGQWQAGIVGVNAALLQIAYQVSISFRTLYQRIIDKPIRTILIVFAAIAVQIGILRLMAYWVGLGIRGRRDDTELTVLLRKLALVIREHLYLFVFMMFILTLVEVTETPDPSRSIIFTLVYVLFFGVAWWELTRIEVKLDNLPISNARRSDMVTVLLLLSVLSYAWAYQSAVPTAVVSLFEKLLLGIMLLFVWVIKGNVYLFLGKQKKQINSKAYRIYIGILRSVPWAIMAVCAMGIIGYGHLAWLILSYLGTTVLYLLVLGIGLTLMNMARKKAKLYSIKRFNHGAFIAQDIVSPLSFIGKIIWLLITVKIWFALQGWDSNSYLIAEFLAIVQYPVITVGETAVSLQLVGLLLLAIYLIFRTARWLKTFSYHWLFARIGDLGVRNSLSIFSQYVAALVGVLIALNVLGIDLTSLAVFAGALGVGVGLGLQDIAKNFISGILLLIERPLRSGDWVAIDGMEGTVKSIGMRAIIMETFDKQEVIIPNGNAISNSFTNYTHSNSITRTVLYIGAAYDCPPSKVLAVLRDVIAQVPGILTEPAPAIILWEYADSSINYRIQYYVDLDDSSLLMLKNTVLNDIWEAFAKNEIEIPFPQRDVHFRNALVVPSKVVEAAGE